MFSSCDWDFSMSRTNNAHEPTEGNNMIQFAPERRSGMVIRDMEQTGNPVIGNFVQQQQPLEARDPTPAFPALSVLTDAVRNPSNLKKKKNKKDDVLRPKKAASSSARKRIVWDDALHAIFDASIQKLGGDAHKAVPKKILELMNVPDLTRENVASHLQKYRLNLKKKLAEKSKAASDVGSMSLPNQPQYDSYGHNGHPNWEFQPQYYPQMMNRNEWCQSVPPYRNMYMGAQMAPLYESVMLRRYNEQLPILDGMVRTFPKGGSFPVDMGRDDPYYSMQIPYSSWTRDIRFRSYPNGNCALPSQDFLSEGLPYEFSHVGIEDSELPGLLNVLKSQPSEFFPHQSQQSMVSHQAVNAIPRQSHGSMIPNQGAAFDTQGMAAFVDKKPDPRSPSSNAAFGSMLPDPQGGTGRSENEHGVNGLPQVNTPNADLSSGTALAPPDLQQGATRTGLYEDMFGSDGLGQANGPTGSSRGFGGKSTLDWAP